MKAGAIIARFALVCVVLAAPASCGAMMDSGGWSLDLSAPAYLTATPESSSVIALAWSPVSGAAGYHVYYSARPEGPFVFGITVYTASARHPYLRANTTYYYRVSAFNSGGESPPSSTAQATTLSANSGYNPFVGTWNGFQHDGERIRAVIGTSTWTISWPDHPLWVLAEYGTNTGTYTYTASASHTATATFSIGSHTIGTGTVSGNTMSLYITGYGPMTLSK